MLYDLITDKIKCYLDIIGLLLGTLMQFILGHKKSRNKIRFAIFIITSSIFSAIFVVTPIVEHYNLGHTRIAGSAYALSSIISLQIISFITSSLPEAIRNKVLEYIGAIDVKK